MTDFPCHKAAKLTGHHGAVHCVTFSGGAGSYILTGSADRTIRLFNPSKLQPPPKPVTSHPSSSSSPSAAAIPHGTLVQTFSAHGYEVLDVAVSESNSRFASVGGDRLVFLWDVSTGTTVRRWAGHSARVDAVAFGGEHGDDVVVSGSFDTTVKIWDARSGAAKPVQTLDGAGDGVTSLVVAGARGAEAIWAGSADGYVRGYELRMGTVSVDCVGAPVTSLAVVDGGLAGEGEGEAVLVGSLDGRCRLFDTRDGRCLQEFRGHRNESYRIRSCFGLVGEVVLSGGEEGDVFVWDVQSGEVVKRIESPHEGKVPTAVAWNGRKREWASAGSDGSVIVWNSGS